MASNNYDSKSSTTKKSYDYGYEIENPISLEEVFDPTLEGGNVASIMSKEDLDTLGNYVISMYEEDIETRSEREERIRDNHKLAMQIRETKTFPWENASNIKFPLLTIAALQFSARAYPALVPSTDVVKCRVLGDDPDGTKEQRAKRVSSYMSYQVLEEDEGWEEDHDRLLMALSINGTMFKKSYFDPDKGHNISETVYPLDFVLPYYAKSVEDADRKTHVLHLSYRQIVEKQRQSFYLPNVDLSNGQPLPRPEEQEQYADKGFSPSLQDGDRAVLEMHTFCDLDGDGYEEPYIITVDHTSTKVLRIVPRFEQEDIITDATNAIRALVQSADTAEEIQGEINLLNQSAKIIKIIPTEHFTKYPFIPSPDGGIYDIGFGDLLGPINHSASTLINQITDAGTLQVGSSGFIGLGARLKGGDLRFKPFEWKRVPSAGNDIRSNIVPLPVNPPSNVLFSLLTFLIGYADRLSSSTDVMVGAAPAPGAKATPAAIAQQEGLKTFNAIFKRIHRAMKKEFRKLYKLNSIYLNPTEYFTILGTNESAQVFQQDFLGEASDIVPAADPAVVSDQAKIQRDSFLAERAATVPGYNSYEVERMLLTDLKVPNIDHIYPDPQGPNAIPAKPNPEMQLRVAEEQRKTLETRARVQQIQSEIETNFAKLDAEIVQMQAAAELDSAKAEKEVAGISLDAYKQLVEEMKERRETLKMALEQFRPQQESSNRSNNTSE